MALRSVLINRQQDLTLFGPLANNPGFIEQLAHTVAELKLYRVEPAALEQALDLCRRTGREDTVLGRKLHDLSLIYNELEAYLAGRYLDPDDYLGLLAQQLPQASFIKGGMVWVDGFNGFTPQEEAVLQVLMTITSRLTVTLCLDPGLRQQLLGETELFHPTSLTYHRLRNLALEVGVNISPDIFLSGQPPRFQGSAALAHLEAHFGRWPLKAFNDLPAGIKLVAAANRRLEVEAAAREIVGLAREKKLRWRQVAVLVREIEPYHDLVVNTFRDFNIPFFIDRRRPVSHHPLIELVRAALEAVLENWSYDPVFRYLKSDLIPVARQDIDLLENYVLAHGIRGRQWLTSQPWKFKSRYQLNESSDAKESDTEIEIINQIRERASRHLLRFHRSIKTKHSLTARRLTVALVELLQALQVPRQLEEWRCQAKADGDLDAAQEHEQVWDGLMDLLDELVIALDDAPIELNEYAAILDAGLESLKLRLIPPALDQVVVGTLDRSRQPELEAALILGVGEGLLPARLPEDATFNDREREELQNIGIELAPTGSLQLFHEEFLTYLALTRSRRFLWLSYPLADAEGKALAPSPIIRRLRQLLPQLQEENVGLELPGGEADRQYLSTPRQAAAYLATLLSRGGSLPPLWQEVLSWLCQDKDRERWLALLGGLNYRNQVEPLEPPSVAQVYSQPLSCSISQLETYARCPFRYFLTYGLRLQERCLYQVDATDMGQFYHAALKLFVDELRLSGSDWGAISDTEAAAITSRVVTSLAPQLQHEILSSSARYRYLLRKLEQTLQRAVAVLSEHARRGQFRPLAVETSFGRRGELPPLVLEAGSSCQVFLEGRVDRIDVAHYQDKYYLRVIDYKSSPMSLKLEDVYHGLSLQLPLYLQAALAVAPDLLGETAEPAGLLYFAVCNPILRQKGPINDATEIENLHRRYLKMRGLLLAEPDIIKLMDEAVITEPDLLPVRLNRDGGLRKGSPAVDGNQMQVLLNLAQKRAISLARGILSGQVDISPYYNNKGTGCQFCSYRPVCGFDLQIPGATYRRLIPIKDNFWQLAAAALKGEEGQNDN